MGGTVVKIMKLLILKFSPFFCYLLLSTKTFFSTIFSNTISDQRMFLHQRDTTFVPGKEILGISLKFGYVDCLVLSSNFLLLLALLQSDLSRKFQKCGCVPVNDGRQ